MDTIITPIYPEEITSLARSENDPHTYTLLEKFFHAQLQNLDPSKKWQLVISTSPCTQPAKVTVQGKTAPAQAGIPLSFNIDPTQPVIIEINAWTNAKISFYLSSSGDFDKQQRFALLAHLPRIENHEAILGKAILGAFKLPSNTPVTGFILGKSRLGQATLGTPAESHTWQNLIENLTSIEFTRGIDFNGFTAKADVGTLQFTAYNALIPAVSAIVRGTPVKLIDTATRRPLFTGTIENTLINPEKTGTYTVTFTAQDALSTLAKVRKYQDTRQVGQSWNIAVKDLLKDKYTHQIKAANQHTPLIGSLIHEASLAGYLDIYCATAGVSWYADKTGILQFTDSPSKTPIIAFTDSQQDQTLPTFSPVEVQAAFDTSTIISTLEASNQNANKNYEGEWETSSETITVENPTLKQQYGENHLTIDTCAVSSTALRQHLKELIKNYHATQTITSARFHLMDQYGQIGNIDALLALEILDPIKIYFRNQVNLAHISRITYQITPYEVFAQFDLIPNKGA